MLTHLSIKNLAIIDNISIEFNEGFNVLSGETGAGKSIIVDSVNLALGGRADRSMVRTGEKSASVQAQFSIEDNNKLDGILEEYGIEHEGEVVISRSISTTGKNTCRINGIISTLAQIKSITGCLVDIHGQHSHQSIMDPSTHIEIIDSFSSKKTIGLKQKLYKIYTDYNFKNRELKSLFGDDRLRAQRMDMLKFQMQEINSVGLVIGEDLELTNTRMMIVNHDRIKSSIDGAYMTISENADDKSAVELINSANDYLSNIAADFERVAPLLKRLDSVLIELDDIAEELAVINSDIEELDISIDKIDDRLQLIKNLKRKYGVTIEEILAYVVEITAEVELMENSETKIVELKQELQSLKKAYLDTGNKLQKARRLKSDSLIRLIEEQLKELGMEEAKFGVLFTQRNTEKNLYSDGIFDIEFIISTNRGEEMRSFFKIASGGEISRVMLALKSIIATADKIPTLIFDEIDTGIGGRMATVIGRKMAVLGRNSQVICVTHSAPIAAMSDVHFLVKKSAVGSRTRTEAINLDKDLKVDEIGRMAGSNLGSNIGRDYALELIKAGEIIKNKL